MGAGMGNQIWAVVAVLIVMMLLVASRLVRGRDEWDRIADALRPEIDSNLALLREYWARIRPRESREDEVHSMQKRLYAREFASTPLPPFSRQAFQRELPAITQTGNGKKAVAVTNFYADLARLEGIHRELRATLAAGERAARAANGERLEGQDDYAEFLRIAGRDWDDIWHRVERLLQQGSPLGS